MKIRTDFVTNSSSSSFVRILVWTTDGQFLEGGYQNEEGNVYGHMTFSAARDSFLAKLKSGSELINAAQKWFRDGMIGDKNTEDYEYGDVDEIRQLSKEEMSRVSLQWGCHGMDEYFNRDYSYSWDALFVERQPILSNEKNVKLTRQVEEREGKCGLEERKRRAEEKHLLAEEARQKREETRRLRAEEKLRMAQIVHEQRMAERHQKYEAKRKAEEEKQRRQAEKKQARTEQERLAAEAKAQRVQARLEAITNAVILYAPGEEPENLRKRLNTLFEKLDGAYPDKVITGLQKDHKKWAETVTALYRMLGYTDGQAFLKAYGYTVEKSSAGGHPVTVDPVAIMEELHRRYPNRGAENMDALKRDNPDIPWKTLANNAREYFGNTLKNHLIEEGIIEEKAVDAKGILFVESEKAPVVMDTKPIAPQHGPNSDSIALVEASEEDTAGQFSVSVPESSEMMLTEGDEKYLAVQEETGQLQEVRKQVQGEDGHERMSTVEYVQAFRSDIRSTSNRIPAETYKGRTDIKEIVFPMGVTHIDANAFEGCTGLREVVIPDTVRKIENAAFKGCASLERVVLPALLKEIPSYCFEGCHSLREMTIPENLTGIKPYAFFKCVSLESVTIPKTCWQISPQAFSGCDKNKLILRVYQGTFAQRYVQKNGFRFEII